MKEMSKGLLQWCWPSMLHRNSTMPWPGKGVCTHLASLWMGLALRFINYDIQQLFFQWHELWSWMGLLWNLCSCSWSAALCPSLCPAPNLYTQRCDSISMSLAASQMPQLSHQILAQPHPSYSQCLCLEADKHTHMHTHTHTYAHKDMPSIPVHTLTCWLDYKRHLQFRKSDVTGAQGKDPMTADCVCECQTKQEETGSSEERHESDRGREAKLIETDKPLSSVTPNTHRHIDSAQAGGVMAG